MKKSILFSGYFLCFMSCALLCSAQAEYVTTIAGNGTDGYSGDSSAATACELYYPAGVAADAFGNIYIADQQNHRLRKIDGVSGTITTFAGDGSALTSNPMSKPKGVAVDAAGNVYVAVQDVHRIRKITPSGTITVVAGYGAAGFSGDGASAISARLNYPAGVAVDSAGNVYVADEVNQRIRKIDTGGKISTVAGTGIPGFNGDGIAATTAQLNYPTGVAVDAAGNLYIADNDNNRIRKVDPSGIITTFAGNGFGGFGGDEGPAASAELYNPNGVAVDKGNNVYIADQNNNRIRMVNPAGTITTRAGNGVTGFAGDNGPAADAEFYFPAGVAINQGGDLFIADESNNRVRKVDSTAAVKAVSTNTAINIYPNPATDLLTVKTTHGTYSSLTISNAIGDILMRTQITTSETKVPVSTLPPGTYFVSIKDDNGATDTRLFVKM